MLHIIVLGDQANAVASIVSSSDRAHIVSGQLLASDPIVVPGIEHIPTLIAKIEMVDVVARPIVACMKHISALWDWPSIQEPFKPMDLPVRPSILPHPITCGCGVFIPFDAFGHAFIVPGVLTSRV